MRQPQVSIIIPTFNSGKTLSVALNSIINQTVNNWEVVIMDAVSTDDTIEIANHYKQQYKEQIRIYSEKDKGIYDAMNKGIDKANGLWLFFMGSDDSFYENLTLEKIFTSKEITNNDVVYGNVIWSAKVYDGEFTYNKLTYTNICHQAIFFKKSVFKKTGLYNLKYRVCADWNHNIKWFFSSKIKHAYKNVIVANYADDGFSSKNIDKIFLRNKEYILLKNGFRKLPYIYISLLKFFAQKFLLTRLLIKIRHNILLEVSKIIGK